jgi:hypothetical protein
MQNIYALGLVGLYKKIFKFILIITFGISAFPMIFFEQLWKPFTQGSILPSLVEIGPVVFHKKIF